MENNEIYLQEIQGLLNYHFYIPSYQRGYRWTREQVKALLDDLWEFKKTPVFINKDEPAPFYCLQPITVKKKNGRDDFYEVIDGQQRLTSILIILNYFNENEFKNPEKTFNLEYETRIDSQEYLSNITLDKADENIDYFHIYEAKKTINEWFAEKKGTNTAIGREFYPVLVNQAKVIWYEVPETANSIDIFTRLNIGKIPLTNSELIKALFLRKSNFSKENVRNKQLEIATEWDTIENALQDSSFWHFIYNSKGSLQYDTRIEYIFDLMKDKSKTHEDRHTFNKFSEDFATHKKENGEADIDTLWLNIKRYFMTFQEWYKDRELYHLVGYLIATGSDVKKLKSESETQSKSAFKDYLKDEISKKVNFDIGSLKYKKDNDKIRRTLLLFNIETLLQSKNSHLRFPFDRFKDENEDWDIEHVRSQTDFTGSVKQKEAYLKNIVSYITGEDDRKIQEDYLAKSENTTEVELCQKCLEAIDEPNKINEKFEGLQAEINTHFKEGEIPKDIHSIANLALLDSGTNRGYGNSPFPIKRRIILKNDMKGVFIPLCTKNVFLKSYSKKIIEVMHWSEKDAKDYLTQIETILKPYLPTPK